MVNIGIWAIALIALVILLQGKGNLKGMFVILAGGIAVGIQIIALVSSLKNKWDAIEIRAIASHINKWQMTIVSEAENL